MRPLPIWRLRPISTAVSHQLPRPLTTSPVLAAKPLPPRPVISDSDITESFLKGSGPGGQKINKTSSAVQLKHLPSGIVIKCQETRSRSQNRKIARRILAERVEEAELGEGARTRIKEAGAAKKKKSGEKKRRRKYRALAEGQEGDVAEEEDGEGEDRDEGNGESEMHVTDRRGMDMTPNAATKDEVQDKSEVESKGKDEHNSQRVGK